MVAGTTEGENTFRILVKILHTTVEQQFLAVFTALLQMEPLTTESTVMRISMPIKERIENMSTNPSLLWLKPVL